MRPLSPQIWKRRSVFFLAFAGKAAATVAKERGVERDGMWDWSHLLLTLDLFFLPCHSSWDFQLFHFIYFSYLLPRFFSPSPHSLPIAELYISLTWLGWLLGVTLNGNAILSHLFCRGGCSAFRAKGLLLSRPIYTDAAVNLNVPYPCTIPFMGGQEFTAKQHEDQIFDPVRQNSWSPINSNS